MSDDKMFDYILTRSRTRESSTLTIATVASSASLLLIALYIQATVEAEINNHPNAFDKYKQGVGWVGVLFAGLGIAYREATALTIHQNDERWLRKCA